ncbi:tetraacyldisaccharide 4'-kinase [Ensifer soli]|uniref:tetraacyldisaccharide 4'-kinase n=1 Tax=Ciceribacter sp. sgz301302 TaxID=3342379 RepID=UPI0035B7A0B7
MIPETPPFWWREADWRARLLSPVAWVYGAVAAGRMDRAPRVPVGVPVVCIGNVTVGGAGKTPTAIALGRAALAEGLTPGFLSRGYGGAVRAATLVDPLRHQARDVGDEPLLLSAVAMTAVSRNRIDGARLLIDHGADFILMDDGFQSARIRIDHALVVVDASRGVGNGQTLPAGPLRAPLARQFRHVDAILKIGEGHAAEGLVRMAARAGKPVHLARLEAADARRFAGRRVLAFSGIADPEKFYRTLRGTGADLVATRSFPDHHPFSEAEMAALLSEAERLAAVPVTTSKDRVRIDPAGMAGRRLLAGADVLEVGLAFDDPAAPARIVRAARAAARLRLLAPEGAGG